MKKTLMCATAVMAFAGVSFKAQAEDGWYGRADIGATPQGNLDHDAEPGVPFTLGGDSEPDEVYLGSLGAGYKFGNGFRLESTLTYKEGSLIVSDGINGGGAVPANIVGVNEQIIYSAHKDGDMQSWDVMFNALYDFNRDGALQPYIGAGIGAAQFKASARNIAAVATDGLGNPVAGAIYGANGFNDSETGLALQALAGIGYDITDRLTLDAGYRLFSVNDLSFTGVNETGGAVSYDADYHDHSFTLGLRYAFGPPPPPPPPPPPAEPEVAPVAACSTVNQAFVVYFEWDSSNLTSQASAVIDQAIANIAEREDCSTGGVTIVGHTDTSGASAYNQRLSARRAAIVSDALQSRGIDAGSIDTDSRGENDLAKATRDGVREPLNRRSEVTIIVQ